MEAETIGLVSGAVIAGAIPVTIAIIRYGPKRNSGDKRSNDKLMTKELCVAERRTFTAKLEAVEEHIATVETNVKDQREDIKEIRNTTTAILKAVKV